MGVTVEDIDIRYVDEFVATLQVLAADDHWKNVAILNSIRVLKYEQKHPEVIIREDITEELVYPKNKPIAFDRKIRSIEGNVELHEDGTFTMRLVSGIVIQISKRDRSYQSVSCYYLKLHFPELTSRDIMERVGYTDISSVNKAVITVDNWYLTGVFPKSVRIITEEYVKEF